ncbi:FAD-dependent oxidoreductase [Streptomyces monticola]|uniref:FAD-dependent oxidoreductase n=1 Tax=Streptomyces monticola TaxID=2666263 RepID=A0ABW2JPR8_9ACTN
MRTVAVVGASLAGLSAVRALRAEGYDGRVVVIGAEEHQPYDRPPLSKEFLTGKADEDQLALSDGEETAELDAEWLLGVSATGLDSRGRTVVLADGSTVTADGVVIATGASARRLPGTQPRGVRVLRTLDDARALRDELAVGQRQIVVVGGGFIGAETAASCAALGHEVTVVEAAPLPLLPQLGSTMAEFCAGLHARGGVRLICGRQVAGLRDDGRGAVTGVDLSDGSTLPADLVVVGIGAAPNTAWLSGSSLAVDDGVLCDDGCVTALPQVVAVGDVARVGGVRQEHWTSATQQPAVAVRNLLAGRTLEHARASPYFWSDQYGARIQFAGRREGGESVRIAEGSLEEGSFLALFEAGARVGGGTGTGRGGGAEGERRVTAALAVNRPRPFMRARKALSAP